MVYKTFPTGGVHPEEEKLTSSSVVQTLALPVYVALPLSQHIGTPALPVVSRGEKVRTGQLLASAQGFISANIHASVSGRVNRIDTVTDMSGYRQPAIIIDREGDEWDENIDLSKDLIMEIRHTPEEIIKKCSDAGLVGMGGAAFPTHAKLAIPEGKKCNILIINGVECEPYLTSDHRLMIERGEEMMTGVAIIMKALRVSRAVIGIETNKPDAIENLNRISSAYNGISVQGLMVKYPQGAEKQLVKAILNREVPPGKLPSDLGVMVQNVATALAVYEAVQKNKPLIERIVTVTGKLLAAPGNFYVRTGTPVINLIEAAGGLPVDTGKIIIGGPMMGKAINSTEVPVVKGTLPAYDPCGQRIVGTRGSGGNNRMHGMRLMQLCVPRKQTPARLYKAGQDYCKQDDPGTPVRLIKTSSDNGKIFEYISISSCPCGNNHRKDHVRSDTGPDAGFPDIGILFRGRCCCSNSDISHIMHTF
jgi:electron transport complex protein RnfC